jgi:hypothetical protein
MLAPVSRPFSAAYSLSKLSLFTSESAPGYSIIYAAASRLSGRGQGWPCHCADRELLDLLADARSLGCASVAGGGQQSVQIGQPAHQSRRAPLRVHREHGREGVLDVGQLTAQ